MASPILQSINILTRRRPHLIEAICSPSTEILHEADSAVQESHAFRTTYGLQFRLIQRNHDTTRYALELTSQSKFPAAAKVDDAAQKKHYRVFPDWQTSFIWKDAQYFGDKKEDAVIDEDDFEVMYPAIATPFSNWRHLYETEFEAQGIHVGQRKEVFPDAEERVAWFMEGLLMSCWIVLQDDVETVRYCPREKAYQLSKGNLNEQFESFMSDLGVEVPFDRP